MFTKLRAASLIPSLLLTQVNYDYPDNSNIPVDLTVVDTVPRDSRYQGIFKNITPWSEYQGVKNNQKTIHRNRQVWQFIYVACKTNEDGSRNYFYTTFDAETHQELAMPVVKSGRQFGQPRC